MTSKHLFSNARIFTACGDNLSTGENCLLVSDDRIEYVGRIDDSAVREARQVGVREHDVGGCLISPGFFDGHMHILPLEIPLCP